MSILQVSEPIEGATNDKLILLAFKSIRDRVHPNMIQLNCIYQWGDKSVLLMMRESEPRFTLSMLTSIAHDLQVWPIGNRYPVTHYIRKALWYPARSTTINHGVYVYGRIDQWRESL